MVKMKSLKTFILSIIFVFVIAIAIEGTLAQGMPSDTVTAIIWNLDGSKIAVGHANSVIEIYDAKTKEVLQTMQEDRNGIFILAWNTDGTRIASVNGDNSITVWDT